MTGAWDGKRKRAICIRSHRRREKKMGLNIVIFLGGVAVGELVILWILM